MKVTVIGSHLCPDTLSTGIRVTGAPLSPQKRFTCSTLA